MSASEAIDTLRALDFALGRTATGASIDSSSEALFGGRPRLAAGAVEASSIPLVQAVGTRLWELRDLTRRAVGGGGVPISYVGAAAGIVGTAIGSGAGGGGGGGGDGGPVVTMMGLGSFFF